jgi:hypothetical protein
MAEIDSFLAAVSEHVSRQLNDLDPSASQPTHWLVVESSGAIELSTVQDSEPHELLAGSIDEGATAAAFVTYAPGPGERVVASVLVAEPRNSDIRRTFVIRRDEDVRLAPWEYTV